MADSLVSTRDEVKAAHLALQLVDWKGIKLDSRMADMMELRKVDRRDQYLARRLAGN